MVAVDGLLLEVLGFELDAKIGQAGFRRLHLQLRVVQFLFERRIAELEDDGARRRLRCRASR